MPDAYGARYLADATFTNVNGSFYVGREEFDRRHEEIFRGVLRGTTVAMTINKLRFVRPDVATSTSVPGSPARGCGRKALRSGPTALLRSCLLMVLQTRRRLVDRGLSQCLAGVLASGHEFGLSAGNSEILAFVHCTRKLGGPSRDRQNLRLSEPFMSLAASTASTESELIGTLSQAVDAVEALFADARRAVAERVVREGRANARALDREQRATHGLAWLATYVEALRQLAAYAQRLAGDRQFRRGRGASGAHRRRRISRADRRRHSDEPGRDRASRPTSGLARRRWRRGSIPRSSI